MLNLFDIARQAQSGGGFDWLSRQYELPPAQGRRAVDALVPAFALAFQRAVLDPDIFAQLLRLIGSGQYDRVAPARPPSGEPLLTLLFRDPDAVAAIASQAAAATGIGAQILMRMLPTLAATLVGGLSHAATLEGSADLLRQWADGLDAAGRRSGQERRQPEPQPAGPPPSAVADPFAAWLALAASFSPWSAAPAPVGGAPARRGAVPPAAPAPPPTASAESHDAVGTVARMFETGHEVGEQYLASLRAILDAAWAPFTAPPPTAGQR